MMQVKLRVPRKWSQRVPERVLSLWRVRLSASSQAPSGMAPLQEKMKSRGYTGEHATAAARSSSVIDPI
jgi:hypothetical protein